MSDCTGCQLFQSSPASCFNRTDNKEVLAIPLQLIKIFISWVTVRKLPDEVKHFQESEKKPSLNGWNDRSTSFIRQIKHTVPVPSGKCSKSPALLQDLPPLLPSLLTHSGHEVWQELFCIDVVITSVRFCEHCMACAPGMI